MQSRIHRSRKTTLGVVATSAVAVAAIAGAILSDTMANAANEESMARYEVIFVPSWNGGTHPLEYPYSHAKQGLMTPMIGATHGPDYRIFAKGMKPSPGLERLSEMGKHDPLDAEIRAAIAAGKAGSLIELSEGSPGPVHASVSHTFEVSEKFPLVSLVGMIAPSPDWFYGISAVELRRDGKWVPSVTQTVYAWDSGGDAGTTYLAEDADLNPKEPTDYVDTKHLKGNSVGVFIFKRLPDNLDVTKS